MQAWLAHAPVSLRLVQYTVWGEDVDPPNETSVMK